MTWDKSYDWPNGFGIHLILHYVHISNKMKSTLFDNDYIMS